MKERGTYYFLVPNELAQNILKMEELSDAAEAQISKMEHGNKAAPTITLDVPESN